MSPQAPLPLGRDAWLVQLLPEGEALRLPLNSLVLVGSQPVLVDTGAALARHRWWQQVEAVVDPVDVRWIFLRHDDADHAGNLDEALRRCPEAKVLTSPATAQRLHGVLPLPPQRCRFVDDGEVLHLAERQIEVLWPPAYDSPATRGVFDHASGVYWAADCFGAPVPHLVNEAADIDSDIWTEGFVAYHRNLSPWARHVDPDRWRAAVGRVAALSPRIIASTHGPAIRRPLTVRSLELLAELAVPPAAVGAPPA